MPRPRRGQRPALASILGVVFNRERVFPVCPVAILDTERYRSADRLAVSHAGESVGTIFFNFLTSTAPITELPAV